MIPIRCHTVSGVALSTVQDETRLLMMKRVKGGFWCHVAGTVEAGETGWQTIVREFREETGIVVHELYNGQYLEQFTSTPPTPSVWCRCSWSTARQRRR